MKTPLFVDGDAGLLLFPTAEKLAASADPQDVESGAYGPVFDWEGRRLELDVVRDRRRGFGGAPLVLVEVGDEEPDVEGLKELLDRSLELMGEIDSLDELRRRAVATFPAK